MMKKILTLIILLMVACCFVSTAQTTRDPWLWPFAQNSIWNMPIGSNAVYIDANIGSAGFVGIDDEYLYIVPQGSPIRNIYGPHSWNDRCPTEDADKYQGQMQIQDDLVVGDATGAETPNNVATFLQNDGKTLIQLAPFTRCSPGATVFGWKRPDLDIKGPGIEGGHWGSGLSGIGGSIRKGELLGTEPIRHVLKINIFAEKYCYFESDREGFRWPADRSDNYAWERYGIQDPQLSNPNRALVMGSLLAIPSTVSEASLNLTTAPAKKIFKALQDYGAYIVDDAAWDAHYICAEDGVKAETEAAFGISMHGYSGDYHDDINKILAQLKVVDNNGPDNIGGGGTPRAPLAPPFQEGPVTATVKIMPLGDSHTHGENGAPSYRGPLRSMLIQNGYSNIDFVGPQYNESPGDVSPVDGNHAGYAGFTIGPSNLGYSIRQSIDNIMTSDPDVILLELGINDNWNEEGHGAGYAASADDRYEALVQRIREIKPGVKILVATLLPVKWDVNYSNSGNNYDLNQRIASLPSIYPNVYFVDMYEQMKAVVDVNTDYSDDIHFNQAGYTKMAQVWYDALVPILNTASNQYPTAAITSPANNASFTAPASITINATATDTDGTVTKVEFYNGNTLLGSDASAPYSYTVTGAAPGFYDLKLKVEDNLGAVSPTVTTTVVVYANTGNTKFTGTGIGTAGSYNNSGTTFDKALDGSIETFFDGATADGNWVGLDLGSAKVVKEVRYAPRANWGGRMNAGKFQGSATADFASPVDLHVITTNAREGLYTQVVLSNTVAYRYVRYLSPVNSYGDISELEFWGASSSATCNGTGTGLNAVYFNNMTLAGSPVLTTTHATVNFGWGTSSPTSGINADGYSVRWTGEVQPCYTQAYTFESETDDGVRLWVNGVLLIDKWINQGPTLWTGTINLTAGQKYTIKMEYYENTGGAVARLRWSSASQTKQIIPSTQLYPTTVGQNVLANPGFEIGSPTQTPASWGEWNAPAHSYTEVGSGSHGGSYHLTHWNSAAYEVATFQTVTSIPNGTYTASVWVMSSGGQQYCQLGVYGYGGSDMYVNIPAASTWTQVQIPGIVVTNGQCTVDFYTFGNANNWSVYDDVSLTMTTQTTGRAGSGTFESHRGEKTNAEAIVVYPVPTKKDFTITLSGFKNPELSITDVMGRVQFATKTSESSVKISHNFNSGIYIITVRDATHRAQKRIVVE